MRQRSRRKQQPLTPTSAAPVISLLTSSLLFPPSQANEWKNNIHECRRVDNDCNVSWSAPLGMDSVGGNCTKIRVSEKHLAKAHEQAAERGMLTLTRTC